MNAGMTTFYYAAKGLSKFIFSLLTRREIKGAENIPKEGPLIVVANHLHNADIPLLVISMPRAIVFMAKEELFRSWGRWAVKELGALPVRRGAVDRATLRQAIQVLKEGKVLGIYPEGTRSPDSRLQPARPGVAMIAYHSQSPILPVAVTGTEKIAGASWWLRRLQLTVTIGKPFTLAPTSKQLNKETLASLTTTIMEHVAELLPPDYRGVYSKASLDQSATSEVP